MRKYRIAWLPGDGIGPEVCEAARVVLDAAGSMADYLPGDIGWEFWRREGDALPARTIDLLRQTDCAFFGAITSKPAVDAVRELAPELRDRGVHLSQPDRPHAADARPVCLPAPLPGVSRKPAQLPRKYRPGGVPGEHRGHVHRRGVPQDSEASSAPFRRWPSFPTTRPFRFGASPTGLRAALWRRPSNTP